MITRNDLIVGKIVEFVNYSEFRIQLLRDKCEDFGMKYPSSIWIKLLVDMGYENGIKQPMNEVIQLHVIGESDGRLECNLGDIGTRYSK